jgi:hypothetical protein
MSDGPREMKQPRPSMFRSKALVGYVKHARFPLSTTWRLDLDQGPDFGLLFALVSMCIAVDCQHS